MSKEPLFEVDPKYEVEAQVDAMFMQVYAVIPDQHHKLLIRLERDMINALKAAMRLPATEPVPPSPNGWPSASYERLAPFLSPAQRREVREARERRQ